MGGGEEMEATRYFVFIYFFLLCRQSLRSKNGIRFPFFLLINCWSSIVASVVLPQLCSFPSFSFFSPLFFCFHTVSLATEHN